MAWLWAGLWLQTRPTPVLDLTTSSVAPAPCSARARPCLDIWWGEPFLNRPARCPLRWTARASGRPMGHWSCRAREIIRYEGPFPYPSQPASRLVATALPDAVHGRCRRPWPANITAAPAASRVHLLFFQAAIDTKIARPLRSSCRRSQATAARSRRLLKLSPLVRSGRSSCCRHSFARLAQAVAQGHCHSFVSPCGRGRGSRASALVHAVRTPVSPLKCALRGRRALYLI